MTPPKKLGPPGPARGAKGEEKKTQKEKKKICGEKQTKKNIRKNNMKN
jgi:hypothetical protein